MSIALEISSAITKKGIKLANSVGTTTKEDFETLNKQIAAARQQEESAIAASNTWVRQLAEIRQDFESILSYITKATENTVI